MNDLSNPEKYVVRKTTTRRSTTFSLVLYLNAHNWRPLLFLARLGWPFTFTIQQPRYSLILS